MSKIGISDARSEGPFGRSLYGNVGKGARGLCHVHRRGRIPAIPKGEKRVSLGGYWDLLWRVLGRKRVQYLSWLKDGAALFRLPSQFDRLLWRGVA